MQAAVSDLSEAELQLYEINSVEAEAAEGSAAAADGGQAEPRDELPSDEEKAALVDRIAELREVRTARADRLRLVMDAFEERR